MSNRRVDWEWRGLVAVAPLGACPGKERRNPPVTDRRYRTGRRRLTAVWIGWIPAFAGMTYGGGNDAGCENDAALTVGVDSAPEFTGVVLD